MDHGKCEIVRSDTKRPCGKPAVGECTYRWSRIATGDDTRKGKPVCELHFKCAQGNGFLPARYKDDGSLKMPQVPQRMRSEE